MKVVVAIAIVLAATTTAAADPKLIELTTGYEKEAASCQIHRDGVAKVDAGVKLLLADAPDDAVAADGATLDAAQVTLQRYCDELDATLALLRADPKATYRALEHQLDDHDNKIRKLRQTTKKLFADIDPAIRRLVPRINGRVGAPEHNDAPTSARFPSGRAVALPKLPGTWKLSGTKSSDTAEYTEGKTITTITVKAFAGATCEQQRKAITGKQIADLTSTEDEQRDGAEWKLVYTRGKRTIQALCMANGRRGGWLSTIDVPVMTSEAMRTMSLGGGVADDAITNLAAQMLAQLSGRLGGSATLGEPPH